MRHVLGSITAAACLLALAGCAGKTTATRPRPSPAPVEQTHETLSADAMFAFGKASLKTGASNVELDGLVQRLKQGGAVRSVRLIGYSDRVGSEDANLKLSRQRAESVRDYLIAQGVPPATIEAMGRGSADPVVDCDQPRGKALVDCLAPNRRVEVDIVSTR